jgi:hypothetical protein
MPVALRPRHAGPAFKERHSEHSDLTLLVVYHEGLPECGLQLENRVVRRLFRARVDAPNLDRDASHHVDRQPIVHIIERGVGHHRAA